MTDLEMAAYIRELTKSWQHGKEWEPTAEWRAAQKRRDNRDLDSNSLPHLHNKDHNKRNSLQLYTQTAEKPQQSKKPDYVN